MAYEVEKPTLEWEVTIRETDGALVRIAEVHDEPRAKLFVDTLKECGVGAIYYKLRVDF